MELAPAFFFQLLNGVVWGLIFALIALGLSLTFGLMNLMNVAHGSFYMIGAVVAATLIQQLGFGFWLSCLLSTVFVGLLGLIAYRFILIKVIHAPPVVGLLATAGLLLVLDNTVLSTFGSAALSVDAPFDGGVSVFGIYYPMYRIVVAVIAVFVLLAMFLFLSKTRYGLWMRAVPQNRELAIFSGMSPARVNKMTVVLGSLLAGLAGSLITPIAGAHFQMDGSILAAAFMVITVGGARNLGGVIFVAVALGIIRGIAATFVSPVQAEIISLVVLLPILLVRPNGIFGGRDG